VAAGFFVLLLFGAENGLGCTRTIDEYLFTARRRMSLKLVDRTVAVDKSLNKDLFFQE
jgi:hypothetical protein